MKIHELEQDDEFKVIVYGTTSPIFKYLGDYRHGYDHYTAEDSEKSKFYFSSVTEVVRND